VIHRALRWVGNNYIARSLSHTKLLQLIPECTRAASVLAIRRHLRLAWDFSEASLLEFNASPIKASLTREEIEMANSGNSNPGNFANDHEKASEAGKKGGQASGGNFANDPERASEAGQKGGQASGGNFANDPERASEAGKKGGQASGGNFANDREKASEAGKKGGQNSHGGN
jgi:general stress protein YciG